MRGIENRGEVEAACERRRARARARARVWRGVEAGRRVGWGGEMTRATELCEEMRSHPPSSGSPVHHRPVTVYSVPHLSLMSRSTLVKSWSALSSDT